MREAAFYYNEQLLKIIAYGIVIMVPVWLIFSNYSLTLLSVDWGGRESLVNVLLNMMLFVIFVHPLFLLYKRVSVDEEMEFKEMVKGFIWSIGPILAVGTLISILIYGGIFIFYIPGFVIAPLLFILPFTYQSENTLRDWVKTSIEFYINNFMQVWIQIIFWICFTTLLWFGVLYLTSFLEMNYVAFLVARLVFSIVVFPFVVFAISEKLLNMKEEAEEKWAN
ncbi:hypothetical protein H9649_09190 [Sporosarcina sp. Sa2YVA2]|uniref:DUF4013 domain-containing protein n=1 Tax=Sporosarcina quadrami TaxID=2762234 RepID=A0ABR8U9P7_9BACL|nr:hypothetical protein [Sporosarcina quadrami]MBD7984755.1 hypothetical protein [Sporosarcina quadrami]